MSEVSLHEADGKAVSPLVLHVLPIDMPRGAQRYARAMREALDGASIRHRTLTIFASDARVLDADIKLGIAQNRLAKRGFDPRAVLALRHAVKGLRPNLVVVHGSQPLKYAAAALPLSVPVIYYKIGIVHARARMFPYSLWHAALLRRAAKIAGVSNECLEESRDAFGVSPERLVLIPNGRDPLIFRPPERRPERVRPKLTFLGHFSRTKRPGLFVDVVASLRREDVAFDAMMIGEGPLLTSLRRRAQELGVEVLGRRDDVPDLLRESDVLVFPSLPDGEGMPGVFIEAGLSGLPVVSTDVPGARTVLADGLSGFIVPVSDASSLVDRTRSLLKSHEMRQRMGGFARDRCVAQFTLQRSVDRWSQLVENTLGYR